MEGKKSFLLYTDLIHTVRKLPKDKQAELFMMILEYVNDENPVTNDLLLEVAFEPVKRQLKRDLIKYEERAIRSRENGKSGGRPPKDQNPEEPRKPSGLQVNPEEPRKPDTVTVNGNVTDNNKRAFVADANKDYDHYRRYLWDIVKGKSISKDKLFIKCKIDISRRNELWEDFISNSTMHVSRIDDEDHAWNAFKKYVTDNSSKYHVSRSTSLL